MIFITERRRRKRLLASYFISLDFTMRHFGFALALICALTAPALAQDGKPGVNNAVRIQASDASASVFIPNFWDPQSRLERPDVSSLRVVRFVADDIYPPFGFLDQGGALTGFNVDLARAICEELRIACTIQARRFDTIVGALERGEADAAIASLAITPAARARVDFTRPYYRTPARFIARKDSGALDLAPESLSGEVAVVADSAHAAFLARHFPKAIVRAYPSTPALLTALRSGEASLAFADGVTGALWLNGADSRNCCAFADGFFLDPAYFGEGVGIAVRKQNALLRRAIDFALLRLSQQGIYTEIYLKYFPVGFF